MAELSTLSTDDRRIVASVPARAARARVAPLLLLALPQLQSLSASLPSYVAKAVADLLAAFERWGTDEAEVLRGK